MRDVTLYVDDTRCVRCPSCFAQLACRLRAWVRFETADAPVLDTSRCNGCMRCLVVCPANAITKARPANPVEHP